MKILFFHPANYLEIGIPQGIAILSARLKQEGHAIDLFDTTFLKPEDYVHKNEDDLMVGPAIYKKTPYTMEDLVKDDPPVCLYEAFQKKIEEFDPNLIAISTMTTNYDFAIDLLKKVKVCCPVIVGGVHATISPDDVIAEKKVDMICVGEGDEALPELCKALSKGSNHRGIKNLWIKEKDGSITKNGLGSHVNLDELPCPDWSLFDSRHLFRPYEGQIYKGGFYISSRGCPGGCSYCVNSTLRTISKGCGTYFRYQRPETTVKHLEELKTEYGVNWLKFGDDTFLLQPLKSMAELHEKIKPLNIFFGCSVRPDTVTREKVSLARDMGCVAMSVGIESGNEEIRRNILNRKISNRDMEGAFRIINEHDIRISSFNMIGLPEERRENVFETIEFNRQLKVKSANVYIIYPFPGSRIALEHHVQHKDGKGRIIPMSKASRFCLSNMTPSELEGLRKTFNLYLFLPKSLWPMLQLAEGRGKKSQMIFENLTKFAQDGEN